MRGGKVVFFFFFNFFATARRARQSRQAGYHIHPQKEVTHSHGEGSIHPPTHRPTAAVHQSSWITKERRKKKKRSRRRKEEILRKFEGNIKEAQNRSLVSYSPSSTMRLLSTGLIVLLGVSAVLAQKPARIGDDGKPLLNRPITEECKKRK